jgi:hypothetical protein
MTYQRHHRGALPPTLRTLAGRLPTLRQGVAILIVLGIAWRVVRYAMGFPIWGDEAFVSINFVVRDFRGMLDPLVYGQIAPLVFMWIDLAISRVLGYSEWALRLPALVAGLASLLLFAWFAPRVLPRRAAFLAVGFFAASYYLVRHGAEVKPYAGDVLFTLLLTVCAWSVLRKPTAVGWWAGLVATATAGPWCSYPAVFTGCAVGAVLLRRVWVDRFRGPVVAGTVLFGVLFVASSAVMYRVYAGPHAAAAAPLTSAEAWGWVFPPLSRPWLLPVWFVWMHTGPMFAYPQGGSPPASIGTFVLFVIGCVRMWRTNRSLFWLLLGPFVFTFIASAMHKYPYGGAARVVLYLAPSICLLSGLGLWEVFRRFLIGREKRLALAITGFVLGGFAVGSMIQVIARPYHSKGSLKSHEAVRAIAEQTRPGDRWVVFNADRRVDYAPYLGDWRGVGGQFVFDALRLSPVPIRWAPPADAIEPPAPGRTLWLLFYRAKHPKIEFDENLWTTYFDTVVRRLGTPHQEEYLIKESNEKREAIEVYRFR